MIASAWHITEPLPHILRALKHSHHLSIPLNRVERWVDRGKLQPTARTKRGNLFTPAAVIEAYRGTPTGKRDTRMNSLQIPHIP
ncbi:hypothetical protein [Arthrobacter sp. YN]|uniref:hypothetical protein n=1 Tax=Arthrobacter sp. YN TaxID=2020486 RepID=UPI000B5E6E51|nr:hypothetical protein [Arthrobacter sp. YN]ASN20690.1 hypothetical protein CGK93_14125 [Arthrobacter sp. YN]